MNTVDAKRVLETALICAPQPVPLRELRVLFNDALGSDTLKMLLQDLQRDWEPRGVELVQVATGWRFQSKPEMREYLDRLQVRGLSELARHNCLIGSTDIWALQQEGREISQRVQGNWRCNSGQAVLEAALRGLGLCQLPDYYVLEHLRSGALVSLLDNQQPPDTAVSPPAWIRAL